MKKPYRFHPPSRPIAKLVDRPRLLDGRFERRLTFLQGGAGFGKTTLLVDALDHNLGDAVGIDLWLGLSAEDDRVGELTDGLRTALGIEPTDEEALDRIVDAVWKESPRDVALVLDDVHHVRPEGSSNAFLEALLEALPANGHLVLASREAPGFPIARLIASGEACVIDERELAFDSEERVRFMGARGIEGVADDWGGWPALLELAATAGTERVGDFVWEEVLGRLPDASIRGLARLAPLDWIDGARIRSVAGLELSVGELLQDLPLVSHGADGSARLHALWRPFLQQVDPAWDDAAFDTALHVLLDANDHREALKLCKDFGRGDRVVDVVRSLTGIWDWSRFAATEIEALLSLVPEELLETPSGRFLDGLLRVHTQPATAIAPLLQACDGFRKAGEASLELATLTVLALLAFFGSQTEGVRQIVAMGEKVDHPDQPTATALGAATLSLLEGRPDEALEEAQAIAREGRDLGNLDHSTAAIAALDAGRPAIALDHVRLGTTNAARLSQPSLSNSRHDALWFEGDLDAAALAEFDGPLAADVGGHLHNTTVFHSVLAVQNALTGRGPAAREHLGLAEALFDPSFGARAAMAVSTARAACAAVSGDEENAARELLDVVNEQPREGLVHRHTLRALGLFYVLVPSIRPDVDGWPLGPCFRLGHAAARALCAAREHGNLAPAADLDWSQAGRFQIYLTPAMNLELAVAASAEGDRDAEAIAGGLASRLRPTLRTIGLPEDEAASDAITRHAAVVKDLLARVPARPSHTTTISVLGPLVLDRDGVPVQDPALRRSRVRDLLLYLIAHPNARRAEVASALWPDKDDRTAANNVRVNLSHLLRVLEPAREGNEPSCFFELDGERFALRRDEALVVDALRFDELLDRAEQLEREGNVGQSLVIQREAIALYRGDYLIDARESRWGEIERTRLRSRYLAAALRAASLLLGKGEFEPALDLTRNVLAIDDLREAAYRVQALVYFRLGDRAAARAVLETGHARFVEAGIEPDEELLRLLRRAGGRTPSRSA